MLEVFSDAHMRAPLDAALAKETARVDMLVTRTGQLLFGSAMLVGLVIALAASRRVGLAIAGASALYLVWATVTAHFFSRGVDTRALQASTWVAGTAVPWVFLLGLAFTQGAAYALVSWVPPLLYAATILAGVARLRPTLTAATGVVGGAVYALLYFVILRERLSPEDAGREIFQPGLQLSRSVAFALMGILCALMTKGLRAVVARAESVVRQQELFGKYRLLRGIAAGGMGEVFEALYCPDGGFQRRVALKRLHPMHSSEGAFVAKFRAEAELTAHLAHPNIVQVLDFGLVDDAYFLAMEYVDGMTLAAFQTHCAASHRSLGPDVVGYIGREILAALAHAHGARRSDGGPLRVVHCDLCPQNVLLSRIGEVKVIDFGVARALRNSAAAQTRSVIGHLSYLAPETIVNEPIDERTDLYAVGVILWELLAGEPLFEVQAETAVLGAILSHEPSPVTAIRPDLVEAWNDFFARALARDPRARYRSARAMAEALDAIAGTRGDDAAARMSELVELFRASPAAPRVSAHDGATTVQQLPRIP